MLIIILIVGAAAGTVLGLRPFKVVVLVPAVLLAVAAVVASGVATGLDPLPIALRLLATVASVQIGYVGSAIGVRYILRIRANSRRPMLFHAMQVTIGQELRTTFVLPQKPSREMATLLARINEQ